MRVNSKILGCTTNSIKQEMSNQVFNGANASCFKKVKLGEISFRFEIKKEIDSNKKYREFEINFENFLDDLEEKKENLKFSDLELIFKDLKTLFEKRGFIINWKALEKQSLDETINALAMTSPFSLEEKQVLLEAKNLEIRKTKISEILNTYTYDQFDNTTLQ